MDNTKRKDASLKEQTGKDFTNVATAAALQDVNVPSQGVDDRWEDRSALSRVDSLLDSASEIELVEYQQLRLEKVILVGIFERDRAEAEESLRELAALATTAGAKVLDGLLQRKITPDPGSYLGKGKAEELARLVASLGADTVVVDTELPPSSRRGLEDIIKVKVIDRTAVILDIFAQHASSREGKAQVELAQLEYLLPRLRGWGQSMSRQAGGRVAGGEGIGSRGPGETKIELDRRRIRSRMSRLRKQLKAMEPARDSKAAARRGGNQPAVVLVGYTNAGKSSLLNRLTDADVLVHNALFATLDPTVRLATTPTGRTYTLSDTVGFVRKLPHQLVEAFRSTLEEVKYADLVLHVVDGAHPDPLGQVQAVHETLAQIGSSGGQTELIVINKADLATPTALTALRLALPGAVVVSAYNGQGIPQLQERIAQNLPRPSQRVRVVVPWQNTALVHQAHETGQVLVKREQEDGTFIDAWVPPALAARLLASQWEAQDGNGVEKNSEQASSE